MRLTAFIVTIIVGLVAGLLCFRPSPPVSKAPEPKVSVPTAPKSAPSSAVSKVPNRLLDTANCKSVFQTLENAKQELARSRMHVNYWGDPSSYETAQCLHLLDKLDSCLVGIQDQIIRAGNGEVSPPSIDDVTQFYRLVEQYNAVGDEFKKVAKQKWGDRYRSE